MLNIDPLVWAKMVVTGYLLTISLETPVLLVGLGKRYLLKEKLLAGVLLTAASYPFVTVVFPLIWNPYEQYLTYITVSEIFAPLSEIAIFACIFQRGKELSRSQKVLDYAVIIAANLVSYLAGELLKSLGMHFA